MGARTKKWQDISLSLQSAVPIVHSERFAHALGLMHFSAHSISADFAIFNAVCRNTQSFLPNLPNPNTAELLLREVQGGYPSAWQVPAPDFPTRPHERTRHKGQYCATFTMGGPSMESTSHAQTTNLSIRNREHKKKRRVNPFSSPVAGQTNSTAHQSSLPRTRGEKRVFLTRAHCNTHERSVQTKRFAVSTLSRKLPCVG